MKGVVKYFEFINNSLTEEELLEMANVTEEETGIEDVVIWIGPNPHSQGKRIKVSNIPNKICSSDCFTLTIPKFEIIGDINTRLIDSVKLEKIKEFVNLNLQLIEDYSDLKISTKELVNNLKPVKK